MYTEQELIRQEKLTRLRQKARVHPDRYEISHELKNIRTLRDDMEGISAAGRILSIRKIGKLTFMVISDLQGSIQLALKQDDVGKDAYDLFHSCFDIGDWIGVKGKTFTTKTGEKTVRISEYVLLGKSLKVLPEKWHGLTDKETRYRQRYLDLIMSRDTADRFLLKTMLVREIRRYLEDRGFLEAETPVLNNNPSGALAKPFLSHHEALDIDVYLRIAPETYLKRLIAGGYTKVFEFARCFRNEGISPVHLQDFTMLECYAAYWNYEDNMKFVKDMLLYAVRKTFGSCVITIGGTEIDLSGDWERVTFRELILRDAGIDIDSYSDSGEMLAAIREKGIELEHENIAALSKGSLIDLLYKKVSRPKLVKPVFLTELPIELSPLARTNSENQSIADRFQLVINGAEIINGYSELVDPAEQAERLRRQAVFHQKGDSEAMVMDEDYILALEYGLPPVSGWGMGIERLLQVLTGCENIRDCVLFPLMRKQG